MREPMRAAEMANPMGRNMIPSVPWRVKMGRKTRTMMMMAKKMGRVTSSPLRTRAETRSIPPWICL